MKCVLIFLVFLCLTTLYSCENPKGKMFLGTWKNKQHDSIEVKIRPKGYEFALTTFVNKNDRGTAIFVLKDSILTPKLDKLKQIGLADDIKYNVSSDRLSFQGIEWDRISD